MTRPHFVSRTAHVLDDKCPRARYNSTILLGWGVMPAFDSTELIFGKALHAGHETLWTKDGDIELAAAAVKGVENFTQLPETQQFLVESLVRAYHKVRYPVIKEHWTPLLVEKEAKLQLGESDYDKRPIIFLAKPDAIFQHKQIGLVQYDELKSTRIMTANFLESWNYAIQLTGGARAVKETFGIEVDHAVMRFFYKGVEAEDYTRSPFTSAWRKYEKTELGDESGGYILEGYKYEPKRPQYFKGWERFNVPESGMTPAEWIEKLPEETMQEQLPQTQPLSFDQNQVDRWIAQITWREGEIARAVDMLHFMGEYSADFNADLQHTLDTVFPMKTEACHPAMGLPCPFKSLCWNEHARRDPLNHGFVRRVPHHESELEAIKNG